METRVDYLIIGAGPAGLQLGYFMQKNKRNYLILEQDKVPGAFFKRFPRHNQLISINKVYTGYDDPEVNLRWDWNSLISDNLNLRFGKYSQDYFPRRKVMLEYLADFSQKSRLNIRYSQTVTQIDREQDGDQEFIITTKKGDTYRAKHLIMATGVSKPYMPDIDGIELATNYYDLKLGKEQYKNKRILILGKGNSAFETADYYVGVASLIHIASPNPVKFAWRTHYPGHLRAVNNNVLDTYQLKSQNALINAHVQKIQQKNNKYYVSFAYTLANEELETIEYDYVIACTGFQFDASIFTDNCRPKLAIKDRFPKQTSYYESTNIKDLYYAGVINQQRDYKKKQSAFVHGFRYNVKFLARYLEERYEKKPLPSLKLAATAKAISAQIIRAVNQSSAMWQQTGYLGDIVVFTDNMKQCRYYDCVPVDFMKEEHYAGDAHYLVVTLEFGQKRINQFPNTFAIERIHMDDYQRADLSTGIHPIVRHYHKGQLLGEHHLIEDFDSVWAEPVHVKPLQSFLDNVISNVASRERRQKAPAKVKVK